MLSAELDYQLDLINTASLQKKRIMENILIPVDFSKGSVNAAIYGANLCRFFSAKMILFHTYHTPVTTLEGGYIPPLIDMKVEAEDQINKLAKDIKSSFTGIDIECVLKMGFAGDEINVVAKEKDADLIIMGISGQNNAVKEHLIGSVATTVAQNSSFPVLIIPENAKYTKVKKLGYACDLGKDVEEGTSLLKVKYFCSLFDAELEILNVMKPREEISEEKAMMDNIVEEKLRTTKHNSFFIYDEKVDKGLVEYIEQHKIDIIINVPKKHSFLHDLLVESHTKKLVFHSPVPILALHA